jgi:uncharacterized membrane protein YphA (DoxX/SURF4 family)
MGAGAVELAASIMLLIPRLSWMAAFISITTITAAIISHLTIFGIEIMGDGGLLFTSAIIVFFSSLIVLVMRKKSYRDIMSEL